MPAPPFVPHPLLKNPHAMTIAPAFLPRRLRKKFLQEAERRLFRVAPEAQILAHCHWQNQRQHAPTLLILHGLEGSSESSHVLMLAQKAFDCGMNAVRVNLRNCGGTIELSPTLYNAGLSGDLIAVAEELQSQDGLTELYAAGFSLGGNIVLKAAGELAGRTPPLLSAVAAVSPSIDLDLAVRAIEQPRNALYDKWFLRTLKQKIRQKAKLFSKLYDVSLLENVRTLRDFDDIYTAPHGGYGRADNYYCKASSIRVLSNICIPALVIAAQDDPIVPFAMFDNDAMKNPKITLLSTKYGGHAGFVAAHGEKEGARPESCGAVRGSETIFDNFWAENRIISFCQEVANSLHRFTKSETFL